MSKRNTSLEVTLSDGRSLREVKLDLSEIYVEGQYGTSFRASKTLLSPGLERGKIRRMVNGKAAKREYSKRDNKAVHVADLSLFVSVGAKEKEYSQISGRGPWFIKCPDVRREQKDQNEFVQREFDNGSSINHVADRFEKKDSFTIIKMIGRGQLKIPSRNIDQPCLIYEYAGNPAETECTLAKKRLSLYEGNAEQFLKFAMGFARVVQVLHNQGVVHTFIVPRHIIWTEPRDTGVDIATLQGLFTIVGFGYARQADAAGRKSDLDSAITDNISSQDNWFRAPECRKAPTHAAFGYPADIFSIGAILYFILLAPGSLGLDVLKDPPTDERVLKKQVAKWVEAEQKHLVQENENILKIIDSCLRYDPENRYTCVEELIEAIQIAIKANPLSKSATAASDSKGDEGNEAHLLAIQIRDQTRIATEVLKYEVKGEPVKQQYFKALKSSLATDIAHRYGGLGRGHFEVYGHRDRIVASLCRLLGSAKDGDRYRTMTLPDYWTNANLGSLGRFFTMNKHMARHGVKIERLFLVSEDFHNLPEQEQVVLEEQLEAFKALKEEGNGREENLLLKVLRVDKEQIATGC